MPHKKPLPPTDSVPVRLLDECFLQWHTANKWVAHFSSMLSEYDAMENEAKLILLQKVQLPVAMELEELTLLLDLKGLCGELKQLAQRRADHAWQQFWKSPEQTFVLFLAFIREEVKRAGITLGNDFLMCQIMAQIRSRQEHTMLLDHVSDPDKLVEEADKLLQSAFEYGPLQDDMVMVDCVSDDSKSKDKQVCVVMRGTCPKHSKGEERRCFMCGRVGHIAHECPQQKDGKQESCQGCDKKKKETCGGRASCRRGENGVFCLSVCGSAQLQFLTLSVNGVKTQALVDSGAQVSVTSEELFERLAKKPPLASVKERVVDAGKVPLCVRGRCKLQVTVSSHTTKADCIVVSDLNASFILGLPTQAQLGLSIHPAERVVRIDGDEFATNARARKRGGEANEIVAVVADIAPQLEESSADNWRVCWRRTKMCL